MRGGRQTLASTRQRRSRQPSWLPSRLKTLPLARVGVAARHSFVPLLIQSCAHAHCNLHRYPRRCFFAQTLPVDHRDRQPGSCRSLAGSCSYSRIADLRVLSPSGVHCSSPTRRSCAVFSRELGWMARRGDPRGPSNAHVRVHVGGALVPRSATCQMGPARAPILARFRDTN